MKGNVVFISHNINGKAYTTVYAHMRSRSMQEGQKATDTLSGYPCTEQEKDLTASMHSQMLSPI